MFMGKEFVLKHIRLKHAPRVQQERERLFDDLWFARFKAEKDAQQRAAQDLEDQERARWAASQGPPAGGFEAGHAVRPAAVQLSCVVPGPVVRGVVV